MGFNYQISALIEEEQVVLFVIRSILFEEYVNSGGWEAVINSVFCIG